MVRTALYKKVSHEDILTLKQFVKVTVGNKHMPLYVQRVEQSVYEKLGLSKLHYMKEPMNSGAKCLLFTDKKGRNVAFVGLLNNPSRSYPNAVIVSRIVVLPQFQHRGLAVPILDAVGAMLASVGQILFINTADKKFGLRLNSSRCWVGTTFDQKERKYYGDDATHRNRKGGFMWRKRFVGKALHGYSELFEKVAVLRDRRASIAIIDDTVCSVRRCTKSGAKLVSMRHSIVSASCSDVMCSSGVIARPTASYSLHMGFTDVSLGHNVGIVSHEYRDTS